MSHMSGAAVWGPLVPPAPVREKNMRTGVGEGPAACIVLKSSCFRETNSCFKTVRFASAATVENTCFGVLKLKKKKKMSI